MREPEHEPTDGKHEFVIPCFWGESRTPKWVQNVLTNTFVFLVAHYNLWLIPVVLLSVYLTRCGDVWVAVSAALVYLPSYFDGSQFTASGRQWNSFRALKVWNIVAADYLHMKVVRESSLLHDAAKRYIFGYHPHGILVLSRFAISSGNWERLFSAIDFRFLGASAIYRVPFGRDVCLWLGGVDASRATAEKVLSSGRSITVYPGGIPEMFLAHPSSKENILVLRNRLGFIKLAIQHGADLVPVFVFGEKWLYNVWTPPPSVVAFVRKTLNVPLIFFWGRFLWMPLTPPKGKTFGVVYGKPITVTRCEDPSEEQVRELHTVYVRELERLFAMHKGSFGYDDDEKLVIT